MFSAFHLYKNNYLQLSYKVSKYLKYYFNFLYEVTILEKQLLDAINHQLLEA